MKVLKLQWLAFLAVAVLTVSGCGGGEEENIFTVNIDENNAEEVARHGLDMMEAGSLSKDFADHVKTNNADNAAVDQSLNCSDVYAGATGSLTVKGTTLAAGDTEYTLTITFNDCAVDSLTLNGSVTASYTIVGTTETKSVSGSLAVTDSQAGSGSLTLGVSNFWFDQVSDTTTNPDDYSKDFGMTISIPIVGDISVDGGFTGSKLNNPDNPTGGTMTVTASGAARVTAIDNTSFSLEVSPSGSGGAYAPVINDATGDNTYTW